MKIKNIGNKIINIGSLALLPGETQPVDDSFKGNSVLKTFEDMGFISVVTEKVSKKPKAAETKDPEPNAE